MDKTFIYIIEAILYSCLIYFGELLSYYTIFSVFNKPLPLIIYFLPIITTVLFIAPVYIFFSISKTIYCYVYFISGIIHSYLLNQFLFSILYQLINFVVKIPFGYGIFIELIAPFLYNLYGVINARVIRWNKFSLKFKGLKEKKTIAHMSDLHLGAVYQLNYVKRVVNKIKAAKPDIVVITGDLADGSLKFEEKWIEPFNELDMPILFISGNHEEIANKSSVLKCVNETKIKYIGDTIYECQGLNFIGIDYEDADVRGRLTKFDLKNTTKPNILLYHVPEIYPKELKDYNLFLHLAGHTHGGQSIPIHFPTWMLNACFVGLYPDEANERFVYVTHGVGTALTPLRTFSRSEIALITLEPK